MSERELLRLTADYAADFVENASPGLVGSAAAILEAAAVRA